MAAEQQAQQAPQYWQGTFISLEVARRIMAEPWLICDMDADLTWRRMCHTNKARLNNESQQVFVQPPDYMYVTGFKMYFNHEHMRIFRNLTNRSRVCFLAIKRGADIHFPTRVLQVAQPRFEQNGFTFEVTGLNGDFIGNYTYKIGDRVSIQRLVNRIRLDLDPSYKNIQVPMLRMFNMVCSFHNFHVMYDLDTCSLCRMTGQCMMHADLLYHIMPCYVIPSSGTDLQSWVRCEASRQHCDLAYCLQTSHPHPWKAVCIHADGARELLAAC